MFNICQTIEQEFTNGDKMGLLSCGHCDYILLYDERLGDRELIPLRSILPTFRNGQPIPTRQRSVTPPLTYCHWLKGESCALGGPLPYLLHRPFSSCTIHPGCQNVGA